MDTARACFIMGPVATSTSVQLLCCLERIVWHLVETGNVVLRAARAPTCVCTSLVLVTPAVADGGQSRKKSVHVVLGGHDLIFC